MHLNFSWGKSTSEISRVNEQNICSQVNSPNGFVLWNFKDDLIIFLFCGMLLSHGVTHMRRF